MNTRAIDSANGDTQGRELKTHYVFNKCTHSLLEKLKYYISIQFFSSVTIST